MKSFLRHIGTRCYQVIYKLNQPAKFSFRIAISSSMMCFLITSKFQSILSFNGMYLPKPSFKGMKRHKSTFKFRVFVFLTDCYAKSEGLCLLSNITTSERGRRKRFMLFPWALVQMKALRGECGI